DFAITARTITVTADAGQRKEYGSSDPTLTYSVGGDGLATGETEATVFSGSLHRATGETVVGSPYAIDQGSLAANSNYNITSFTGANFAIAARTITVSTASGQSKEYGTADPTLTYSVGGDGLAAGETEATVFSGSLHRATGETVAA